MFKIVRKEVQFGDAKLILETGRIARQATGAVLTTLGNTTVLATVVGKNAAPGQERDFFPLTVNYQEKTYAAGKIPGGFFKREGRPSEKETLTSRLIDRPLRPLFADGFKSEVQVMITVLSTDKQYDSDIAALIGASAAVAISGLPFNGPIGAARVGYVDDMYVLNPSYEEQARSDLDLVVAGTDQAVIMVESEAKELTEDQMLGGVLFGHQEMQGVITAIREFAAEVNPTPWEWSAPARDEVAIARVAGVFEAPITEAYQITNKKVRYDRLSELRQAAVDQLSTEDEASEETFDANRIKAAFSVVEKQCVRESVLAHKPRIDGRDHTSVRPIVAEVGVLSDTHGSALFTRGETQALVVATLGNDRDGQMVDALEGSRTESFMLHYNFPPYCVGEVGMALAPKRREIGHGRLARRGVQAVLPGQDTFPYVVRVVSEITESNGSSSMASVCGSSLALMDAGVPLKAPVAGIAMGLVKDDTRFAILSDILGDEDHLGDMDFKVAGTAEGITALQMDIKIEGITEEIMEKALEQARLGRLHILGEMARALSKPRDGVSDKAPRFVTVKINPDKIRDVIGKGGATIRSICEQTSAEIDIDDDGLVKIFGENQEACEAAIRRVEEVTAEPEIGMIYDGNVDKIVDFGAFVTFMPGISGLVHISQIARERVENVGDYLQEGQKIKVKVLDVDQRGRIKLSIKEVSAEE